MSAIKLRKRFNMKVRRWRWIPGYEGHYKASNTGRVKSVDRMISYLRDGITYYRKRKGRMLVPVTDCNGYLYLGLTLNKKKRSLKVHHLILLTFVGPRPVGKECRHLDGNQRNNDSSNLVWGTRKQNEEDKLKHGTTVRGESSSRSRFTEDEIYKIRRLHENGFRFSHIAVIVGSSAGHIASIIRRKFWTHI